MSTNTTKKYLGFAAAALLVAVTGTPVSAATGTTLNTLENIAGRYNGDVSVRLENGTVFLRGYTSTDDEKQHLLNDVYAVVSPSRVNESVEALSGSDG